MDIVERLGNKESRDAAISDALAVIALQRSIINQFAHHDKGCPYLPCTCGFDEYRKKLNDLWYQENNFKTI